MCLPLRPASAAGDAAARGLRLPCASPCPRLLRRRSAAPARRQIRAPHPCWWRPRWPPIRLYGSSRAEGGVGNVLKRVEPVGAPKGSRRRHRPSSVFANPLLGLQACTLGQGLRVGDGSFALQLVLLPDLKGACRQLRAATSLLLGCHGCSSHRSKGSQESLPTQKWQRQPPCTGMRERTPCCQNISCRIHANTALVPRFPACSVISYKCSQR